MSRAARLARTVPEGPLFVLFALSSLVPLAVLFVGVDGGLSISSDRGFFTGSDGLQIDDHLQYLAWVRDAGEHGLYSNRFDVVSDPRLFLHPMLVLSGLLWKLGVSVQLAYLAWKPVAVVLLFAGFAAYVSRMIGPDCGARAAVLTLALFFLTPAAALVDWFDLGDAELQFGTLVIGLEAFAGGYPWGGYTGTVAIAMVPIFLLAAERLLDASRRAGRSARAYAVAAGLAGMLASWLHPWQGLTLLAIVTGLVAWGRFDRRYLALALPVVMTAAPLVYLFVLSRTDSSFATVSQPNDSPHLGLWLLLALAPAAFALTGVRRPGADVGERMLVLWPLAALVVYFSLQQSWFYHAFSGLSLPLAVLAVRGWRSFRLPRRFAVAAIVAAIVPGLIFAVAEFRETSEDHFIPESEARALEYLDRASREGPVLAVQSLGVAVPAFTGRQTWVGHYYWTPGYDDRRARVEALFGGGLDPAGARALVRESRAAFLVARCDGSVDLTPVLGDVVSAVRRFGCATVYEVGRPVAAGERLQAHTRSRPSPGSGAPHS